MLTTPITVRVCGSDFSVMTMACFDLETTDSEFGEMTVVELKEMTEMDPPPLLVDVHGGLMLFGVSWEEWGYMVV